MPPLSWNDLLCLAKDNQCIKIDDRTPNLDEKYKKLQRELKDNGKTIDDHVHQVILKGKNMVLAKNDFPYTLQSGISHWVFWSETFVQNERILEYIKEQTRLGPENITFFRTYTQSVKGVYHVQVFLRS